MDLPAAPDSASDSVSDSVSAADRAQARLARERPLLGIAALVGAMACIAALDAFAKVLIEQLSVPMVLWGRYAGQFALYLVLLAVVFRKRALRVARTRRCRLQLTRSLVLVVETGFIFLALAFLPLTETIAVTSFYPLLIVLLAVPLLGERIGPNRLAGVIVGCIGMLVMLRPSGALFHPAALAALGSAVLFALYQVLTRRLADTDSGWTTLFYTAVVGTFASSLLAVVFWQSPSPLQLLALLGLGALGILAHGLIIAAYSRAPAGLLANFSYSELAFAAVMGWLLFSHLPDFQSACGMLIIVGSGLFVLYRESLANARARGQANSTGRPSP